MSGRGLSKDVLNTVKNKTGKVVTEKEIHKIASGVGPKTVQSEEQLRRLIKQVAQVVNVPVSESTANDIVKAIKSSGVNPNNMEQMMKNMMGKK